MGRPRRATAAAAAWVRGSAATAAAAWVRGSAATAAWVRGSAATAAAVTKVPYSTAGTGNTACSVALHLPVAAGHALSKRAGTGALRPVLKVGVGMGKRRRACMVHARGVLSFSGHSWDPAIAARAVCGHPRCFRNTTSTRFVLALSASSEQGTGDLTTGPCPGRVACQAPPFGSPFPSPPHSRGTRPARCRVLQFSQLAGARAAPLLLILSVSPSALQSRSTA